MAARWSRRKRRSYRGFWSRRRRRSYNRGMSEFIVGLTGGVASGKSEVQRRFEALGVFVADADVAARNAVAKGSDGLREVVEACPTPLRAELLARWMHDELGIALGREHREEALVVVERGGAQRLPGGFTFTREGELLRLERSTGRGRSDPEG